MELWSFCWNKRGVHHSTQIIRLLTTQRQRWMCSDQRTHSENKPTSLGTKPTLVARQKVTTFLCCFLGSSQPVVYPYREPPWGIHLKSRLKKEIVIFFAPFNWGTFIGQLVRAVDANTRQYTHTHALLSPPTFILSEESSNNKAIIPR